MPSAFAEQLDHLLKNRPRPGTDRRWTNQAFADAISAAGGKPVSEAQIRKYRRGPDLPEAIAPLLDALFGNPTPTADAQARIALQDAFSAARGLSPAPQSSTEALTPPARFIGRDPDLAALAFLRRGHAIIRRLAALSPTNAQLPRDLALFEAEIARRTP